MRERAARVRRSIARAILMGMLVLPAARLAAQEVTPERMAMLEGELRRERERNDQQSRRIEELELTLVNVLAAQDQVRADLVDRAALERQIDEVLARKELPLATPPARSLVTISGQGRFVIRAFEGDSISTDESFELEHLIVQMNFQADEHFRVQLSPGVSHQGAVYILEAYAAYRPVDWLEIQGGRFLIPFSGTHAWAFPSDSFIEPYLAENAPQPFLYAPWWDEGVLATGSLPFGAEGEHELYFAAYVINGFDELGIAGVHKRNIGDNNENKTFGARASVGLRLGPATSLTIGGGALGGKYDSFDDLAFYALEGDVEFRTGPLSLYFEMLYRPTEITGGVIENPAAQVQDVARLSAFKFRPSWRFAEAFTLYAQADYLMIRQPPRSGGRFSVFDLDDEEFAIATALVGLKVDITANFRVALEAGIFERDDDLGDDIPFVALSFFSYF